MRPCIPLFYQRYKNYNMYKPTNLAKGQVKSIKSKVLLILYLFQTCNWLFLLFIPRFFFSETLLKVYLFKYRYFTFITAAVTFEEFVIAFYIVADKNAHRLKHMITSRTTRLFPVHHQYDFRWDILPSSRTKPKAYWDTINSSMVLLQEWI